MRLEKKKSTSIIFLPEKYEKCFIFTICLFQYSKKKSMLSFCKHINIKGLTFHILSIPSIIINHVFILIVKPIYQQTSKPLHSVNSQHFSVKCLNLYQNCQIIVIFEGSEAPEATHSAFVKWNAFQIIYINIQILINKFNIIIFQYYLKPYQHCNIIKYSFFIAL